MSLSSLSLLDYSLQVSVTSEKANAAIPLSYRTFNMKPLSLDQAKNELRVTEDTLNHIRNMKLGSDSQYFSLALSI